MQKMSSFQIARKRVKVSDVKIEWIPLKMSQYPALTLYPKNIMNP